MKLLLSCLSLIVGLVSLSSDATACSCIPPRAPLAELSESDFVFAGEVKSITPRSGEYGRMLLVRFKVETKWKGDLNSDIVIETADNSAACGYPFKAGKSYLVYGDIFENVMGTSICTRTNLLENASEDLRDLDAGEEVDSSPKCGGPTNAVALQAFLFLFIGMSLLRKGPICPTDRSTFRHE